MLCALTYTWPQHGLQQNCPGLAVYLGQTPCTHFPTFPKHIKSLKDCVNCLLRKLMLRKDWLDQGKIDLTVSKNGWKKKNQSFPRGVLLGFSLQSFEGSQNCSRFDCVWFTLWELLVLPLVMVHTTRVPEYVQFKEQPSLWKPHLIRTTLGQIQNLLGSRKSVSHRFQPRTETCHISCRLGMESGIHFPISSGVGGWRRRSQVREIARLRTEEAFCIPLVSLAARHWSWLKPRARWYRPSSSSPFY